MNTVELVGESGYVGADYPNLFVPDRLWMATLRSTVHPLWLSYVLIWQPVKSQISASATGTSGSMKNVSKPSLRAVKVPYPPLPEQRAIAEALSDVDALLGGLDRLIAKKRDIKQAAMQQLLTGQTRLPGFHSEWEVKRLGEIAEIKTGPFGSSLHESDYVQDGTPIITVEHLGEFGVEYRNLPMVSDHDRQRLRGYSLEGGDIVFSRVGSVDRNALIRPSEAGWLFSGRLLRVRPDRDKTFAQFLSYQFHGEAFKGLVRSVAVGQTMACLNTQILKGIIVKLPSVPEQTAIAEVLTDMGAELAALERRREKNRALKQAMMQELLTGRIRLVPAGAVHG
jgi:type I restriction enzyme S subunit